MNDHRHSRTAFFLALILSVFTFAPRALFAAAGDHDSQHILVTNTSVTSTAAAQVTTIATLTSSSGLTSTNSYLLTVDLRYDAPLGQAVSVQISKGGVAIADTVQTITGQQHLTITTTQEAITASTALTVQLVFQQPGLPVKITRCNFTISGIVGATTS